MSRTKNMNGKNEKHSNEERFFYSIGEKISLMISFLEFVEKNNFLSNCLYYYKIVSHSERKFDCVVAQATAANIKKQITEKNTKDDISIYKNLLKAIASQSETSQ